MKLFYLNYPNQGSESYVTVGAAYYRPSVEAPIISKHRLRFQTIEANFDYAPESVAFCFGIILNVKLPEVPGF
jgi:hypothetical protein